MNARDSASAGLRHLERGEPDLAVRAFEQSLAEDPGCVETRELLLEAHRCRSGFYWLMRGYWRWPAASWSRWAALPGFALLFAAFVAAQCAGGFVVLDGLPRLYETNVWAAAIELLAMLGVAAMVAMREHKCVWLFERATLIWLVPADVRERWLDPVTAAECRRAAGYAGGAMLFLAIVVADTLCSMAIGRPIDLWIGAAWLAVPLSLAWTLPRSRTRAIVVAALAIAGAGSVCESLWSLYANPSGRGLGPISVLAFFVGTVALPIVIVLHGRAVGGARRVDGPIASSRRSDSRTR